MIAVIETQIGINRLEHLLAWDTEISSSSLHGTIVSFDPTVRATAHDLGFAVMPVVYVEHNSTGRRREAAARLKKFKSTLLTKRWVARATTRWFKPLNIVYRVIQTQLQGQPTSEITRHAEALSVVLETVDPSTLVYIDGTLGALVVEQAGVAADRLRVL